MVMTGCLKWRDATRALDTSMILLTVASLALSLALVTTGGAAFIAKLLVAASGSLPPVAMLSATILLMAILSNIISNSAAAVIGTPIAIELARQLGLPPEPFVLAVLFGVQHGLRNADGGQLQSARLQRRQLPLQGFRARRRPADNHHVAGVELDPAAVLSAPLNANDRQSRRRIAEARRIALGGATVPCRPPSAPKNVPSARRHRARLGAVQIDSVNVLVRSHYLPLFSRCGPYRARPARSRGVRAREPRAVRILGTRGVVAAARAVSAVSMAHGARAARRRHVGTVEDVRDASIKTPLRPYRAQIRERGPLGASELEGAERGPGGWWGWSESKEILEWLFWTGEVTTARRRNFERLYDLTERVLPREMLEARQSRKKTRSAQLMTIAARALGVATLRDLRDYFRLPTADAAQRLQELRRGGCARAGQRRRLETAGLSSSRREVSSPRRGERVAVAVRFSDLGTSAHGTACSIFTFGSRSTRRRTSASTATTCCRFCYGDRSSSGESI